MSWKTDPNARTKRGRVVWPVEMKERMSEAQNHRCPLCGKRMDYNGVLADQPTYEHVDPIGNGGADHPDNIVITCFACNSSRK